MSIYGFQHQSHEQALVCHFLFYHLVVNFMTTDVVLIGNIITTIGTVTAFAKNLVNETSVCAGVAATVGYWFYNKLITEPLKVFYYVGPVWGNAPPAEICFQMTGVPAAEWLSSSVMLQSCMKLLNNKFVKFDATVGTTVYFTVLTFLTLQFMCQCCFIRPIIREVGNLMNRPAR